MESKMYEVNTYYTDAYKIIEKRESVYKGKKSFNFGY